MNNSATLARSITWRASKQSYLTACLLADRNLVDDCLRGYAYFRWADDQIDISLKTGAERKSFITRQRLLVENLYRRSKPMDLIPEEDMLAELIAHDRIPESGLRSFIQNFMAVIEFDALRKGRLVSRQELETYTTCLATAVMDGLQYFIGNGHPYPKTGDRTLAVVGAHMVHMLRDTREDIPAGFINIPSEDIRRRGIDLGDLESESFRLWVKEQVAKAAVNLQAGKRYINSLDVFRCKIAGIWYCARFEWFLVAIQRDDYYLRREYPERRNMIAWARMVRLGILLALQHFMGKIWGIFLPAGPGRALSHWGVYRPQPGQAELIPANLPD